MKQHSIFGFLGPNGAGKSTTIKLLLGLIQPSGGWATILGHDVQRNSVEIRKRAGYLAQDEIIQEKQSGTAGWGVISTATSSIVFILVALWRFQYTEL